MWGGVAGGRPFCLPPSRVRLRTIVRRPRRAATSTVMPDFPDFRLTVRRGSVLAIDWHPWLTTGGPMMTMLHARGRAGVAIADVSVLRENDVATEAIVQFLAGDTAPAREAIVAWASDCGYRRMWLHD